MFKRIIANPKIDWPALTLKVMERWEKRQTPFMVIIKASPKSHEQLGYLHSQVLKPFMEVMFEHGEIAKKNEIHAKYYIKRAIGFGTWIDYEGGKVFVPSSFESATTEELSQAIDYAIEQVTIRGGFVPLPRTKEKK